MSAHWSRAGFQPLVSARTPTTRVPPGTGLAVEAWVEVVAALVDDLLLPQAAATRATARIMAAPASIVRRVRSPCIWFDLIGSPIWKD